MISEHYFIGAIDSDSPDQDIDSRWVNSARNIVWRGQDGKMRAETVAGTIKIPNPFLPITGVNKCVGLFFDEVNSQLYLFNANSAGTSGIYIYSTQTAAWQVLIQTGTNTVGDPLGINVSNRIQGQRMIYGDSTDGNLLEFINSNGVPTKINVTRYLNNPPANIQRSYLEVIKAPPIVPPRVVYENDSTVNANNLLNSLFQFCYSYLYDDFEESVVSSGSITPLPPVPFSNTLNTTKSSCSRISMYLRTGDANVSKIRIYMRQTQNGVQSGWFIVDTIDKNASSIPSNGLYRYLFYNSGNYVQADPKFTVLLYDAVPQRAGCMELLNGDTLSYSAITEGYDWFKSQFSQIIDYRTSQDLNFIINGVLFFGDYNGTVTGSQPNVELFLTGAGNNDGSGNPITLTSTPSDYFVLATSNGAPIGFTYHNTVSTSISTLLAGIAAAAVSAGWVLLTTKTNSIVIYYPTGTIVFQSTRIETTNTLAANVTPYQLALYPQSSYSYGVVYYDAYGRTNGVISDVTANFNTIAYNTVIGGFNPIPSIYANLNGIVPPPWAVYYHLVKTNTLTYSKILFWVSNQAFSNVGQLVDNQFAYIGVTNIVDYNLAIKATQGVVGYEFQQGDRIMFLGGYTTAGVFNNFAPLDYSVLGTEANPVVNGVQQTGNFVKIAYPSTADLAANPAFKFDGNPDSQNYLIVLYSVSSNTTKSVSGSSSGQGNVYFEFGQQYFIGNPGLPTAYHIGNYANNQVKFNDGDVFARQRTIPIGATFYMYASAVAFSGPWFTPTIASQPVPIITTSIYQIANQISLVPDPFNAANFPRYSDSGGLFWNKTDITPNPKTINVRLRGVMSVASSFVTWVSLICKIVGPAGQALSPYILQHSPTVGDSTNVNTITIEFDGTVAVPSGYKLWLIYGNGEINTGTTNTHFGGYLLRLDVINNVTINIFEPSFSDVYNIQTNNNSRALVQDTTAKQTYFSTLFRFSLPYQVGTTINNTNRFYPNNFDEFDKSKGDVVRMRARQRELRIFQKLRCGRVGVYAKFIKNNAGDLNLITTDTIITPNNIQYFEGEYGIGDQPDALCSSGLQDYFADPIKGYWCRLSQDGVIPISELYKIQTFAGQSLTSYLSDYAYQFGGNAVILAAYNFTLDRPSEAIFVLQGGTAVLPTTIPATITGQSLAFKEEGNAWTSFYDFAPDAIICCENTLFSVRNGDLYSHTNNTLYCNFYGTQYAPFIEMIRNENPTIDKGYVGISMVASPQWNSPQIYTDSFSYPGQVQQSNLVDTDFRLVEGHYKASFLNDLNSIGGIVNGQRLKGTLIFLQLTVTDGSKFSYLSSVAIKFNVSQLVQR